MRIPTIAHSGDKFRALTTVFVLVLAVSSGPILLAGCGGESGNGGNARAHGFPGGGESGAPPAQPAIPVAVEKAVLGSIASYYAATTTLAAEKEAEILARVSGVVKSLGCEEGDVVAEGAVLLTIDNDEYRLRLAQAEANLDDLRSRHERLKEMLAQNLVSAEEFEGVKNNLKAAEAEEGLARLNLSYTSVTAPFTGRVVSRLVDVGHNVNAGTALFVLSDFFPLLARVYVPAKEFKKLKPDQPVELVLESNKKRLTGRIKLISPVIDPSSGTIKITVEVPEYPENVRPGDFAEIRIVTEHRQSSVLVPRIALVSDRGEQVVYVAADSTAERRVVETGFEDDDNVEIINGVSVDDDVVVKGQRSLKHGSRIKILEDDSVADADPAARKGS